MPELIHDERNPEDIDTDGDDHAYDSLRYGLMSRPRASLSTEEIAKREFDAMIKRKKRGTISTGRLYYA